MRSLLLVALAAAVVFIPLRSIGMDMSNRRFVTPMMFGAVGDGISDDTYALQLAIDNATRIDLDGKKYRTTSTLTIPSNRIVRGRNGIIISESRDIAMKVIGQNISLSNFELDGSNSTSHGIFLTSKASSVELKGLDIHHFMGTENDQANGIYCASGARKFRITGCKISEIDAPQNGQVGDIYGSCQGILVMKVSDCTIDNCTFEDVSSMEDGDCIQVYAGKTGDNRWNVSDVKIIKCNFYNIWHRAIKIQASGCTISDCKVNSDITRRPIRAFGIIGDNCVVEGCYCSLAYAIHAISIVGDKNVVRNNALSIDLDKSFTAELAKQNADVIYCLGEGCLIKGNKISGSYLGIFSPNPGNNLTISKNTIQHSVLRGIRIYGNGNNTISITDNIIQNCDIGIELTPGPGVRIQNNEFANSRYMMNVLGKENTCVMSKNKSNGLKTHISAN